MTEDRMAEGTEGKPGVERIAGRDRFCRTVVSISIIIIVVFLLLSFGRWTWLLLRGRDRNGRDLGGPGRSAHMLD